MKALYTEKEFESTTQLGKLKLQCYHCGQSFLKTKHDICKVLRNANTKIACKYCSRRCSFDAKVTGLELSCHQCGKHFVRQKAESQKPMHNFCSRSCAAIYNNAHKKHGTKRSKLEKWLEDQLLEIYPNIEFHFNRRDAIKSELDIYLPKLQLAFELNGIFHYEPIFGEAKLNKTRNNDDRKFQACLENGIELCIIDTSGLTYFKAERSKKFLDIVCKIIDQKLQLIR